MKAKRMVVKDINGRKHVYTLPEYKASLWDGGFLSDTVFYTVIAVLLGVIVNVL